MSSPSTLRHDRHRDPQRQPEPGEHRPHGGVLGSEAEGEYDGQQHESVARYPDLAKRAFIVSSFGKTYHVTGWKVGFVAAPAEMTTEFRKVHQFNVFTVNTPMQIGIANYMADASHYLNLPTFYQRKRDLFRAGLQSTKFKLLPNTGSYFQCVDISKVSELNEADFCQWLTREIGVAAIPLSAFYGDGFDQRVVRFCFAKKDATLRAALERLQRLCAPVSAPCSGPSRRSTRADAVLFSYKNGYSAYPAKVRSYQFSSFC